MSLLGGLSTRDAAGLGWGAPTAYDLIHTSGRVRSGETVLIHAAAGSVGTFAAQFARIAGAGRIVGVVGNPARAGYAAQFGYDQILLREELPAGLGDGKVDVILDPVGGQTRRDGLGRLNPHGRLVAYGNLATYEPVVADINTLLANGASLVTHNSNLLSRTHPERLAASAAAVLGMIAAGQVRVDITAEYELADLSVAVGHLAEGRTLGKSIIRVA